MLPFPPGCSDVVYSADRSDLRRCRDCVTHNVITVALLLPGDLPYYARVVSVVLGVDVAGGCVGLLVGGVTFTAFTHSPPVALLFICVYTHVTFYPTLRCRYVPAHCCITVDFLYGLLITRLQLRTEHCDVPRVVTPCPITFAFPRRC